MTARALQCLFPRPDKSWRHCHRDATLSTTARQVFRGYTGSGPAQLAPAILADYFGCAEAARALNQLFKFAAISGIQEKHWSITGRGIALVFEKLCRDHPWLDRLAVFEDGPTVQIVDRYAERSGKFGRLATVIPHDESEANDELVVILNDGSEITLYRDQVSVAPLHSGCVLDSMGSK
jgi:hypothetical protein